MIREELELLEMQMLSPFAAKSSRTKGRERAEQPCDMRTEYQRDRDRIIHCKAFRRMKHKTQVFLSPIGDHYRTRLTHTLEVSQIARTIAKALFLNEDLTEAIALGHDLGHTPFGHAGEQALDKVCPFGFKHYEQSVRVVEKLEKDGRGLNLTWEVKDGIRNHRTVGNPATLEGKIVRLSDKIAYINHDIDDAIRGHILQEHMLPTECSDVLGNSKNQRLNTMIHDVVTNSKGQNDIIMSEHIWEIMQKLRSFMFETVYTNQLAKGEEKKAKTMIVALYEYYVRHPDEMPQEFKSMIEMGEPLEQVACDYIAGMSDPYAVSVYESLFVPRFWNYR